MKEAGIAAFKKIVQEFYWQHGRSELPWRLAERDRSFDPYKILVSEIMLQQTQVGRVIPKYQEFLVKFPDAKSLAQASLADVLSVWNGLGYNRRAKFLWHAAQMIERDFGGTFPHETNEIQRLPGVGANTAGAIAVYAFNEPVAFIETNIRTVFIHHFFKDEGNVSDNSIRDLVEETLDQESPREWFWALMDYGSYLKQTVGNVSRASKSYAKQSRFAGSKRQARGQIIKMLLEGPRSRQELEAAVIDGRLNVVLNDLLRENMIVEENHTYRLFA